MIKFLTSIFLLIFFLSCEIKNPKTISKTKTETETNFSKKIINSQNKIIEIKIIKDENINDSLIKYVVGNIYFINGVKYVPAENYFYDEVGLATYYGKELHNKKTLNNDFNKVTELLGRHKTLPLPSIVKITNLENGLQLILKINDRHDDNSTLIQVSRKTATLLRFYKEKITKVRIELLSDPSKQMKLVTESLNEHNNTIVSAPTEVVIISNLNNNISEEKANDYIEEPIEISLIKVKNKKLYLKIYNFTSYNNAKNMIDNLNLHYKFTTQKEGKNYSLILGPLDNFEANNLVLSFISKGYKKTKFILK